MLSANQIAGFLSFSISETIRYKVDFLHPDTYLLILKINDVILDGRGQAWPGMPKEAIKTLRSQKLNEVQN